MHPRTHEILEEDGLRAVASFAESAFQFLDHGPLADRELELVQPRHDRIDLLLASCRHPLTVRHDPAEAKLTRAHVVEFLQSAPLGRQPADPSRGKVAAYHFWMWIRDPALRPNPQLTWTDRLLYWNIDDAGHDPPQIAGSISLRIGRSQDIEFFSGNLGYHVFPPFRGHRYAERASRLLLPLARRHGMKRLWITCNPENIASRKTCERLGATLIDIVPIPADHPFYAQGEREKCRYLMEM